jgi:D-serine dehydratase
MTAADAIQPDPLLGPWLKGFPPAAAPVPRSGLAALGWNVLAGDLPLPVAVLRRSALEHNIAWMQAFARARGVDLAPHGKTTMSPQLFARQLDAGAWGITFATVFQLRIGVLAGVRRALIANQVQGGPDLAGIAALRAQAPDLRVVFLVDSLSQLAQIEAWSNARPDAPVFEVLLEVGVAGGRTGVRGHDDALVLARALHRSAAVRLVGIECYEGLGIRGDDGDEPATEALLMRVAAVAGACDAEGLFEHDEVIVSAGGSAVFDLVAARLRVPLGRPVRALLRSGCYVTHDHGQYRRLVERVVQRCGCGEGLRPALEVWTRVQSAPEPGLALLTAGRRDLSFDIEMPLPQAIVRCGNRHAEPADPAWRVSALNDQHAYLRTGGSAAPPQVGDLIGLGISHPCTTFDKWHWMPVVDDDYGVVDAVTIHF